MEGEIDGQGRSVRFVFSGNCSLPDSVRHDLVHSEPPFLHDPPSVAQTLQPNTYSRGLSVALRLNPVLTSFFPLESEDKR
jgi:hypothetical protein